MAKKIDSTAQQVFKLLEGNSSRWDDIGRKLGVNDNHRQNFDCERRGNLAKLEAVIYKWLESECSPVTWDNLIKVLEELELYNQTMKEGVTAMKRSGKAPVLRDGGSSRQVEVDTDRSAGHTTATSKQSKDKKITTGHDVQYYKNKIINCLQQPEYDNAQGIIIVVGMFGGDLAGTAIDVKKVRETFEELDFAVLPEQNPTSEDLVNIIKAASQVDYRAESANIRFFAFYFAGHGGADANQNGELFIKTAMVKNPATQRSSPILHINRYIIKPLKDLRVSYKLFLFDCCQSKGTGQAYRSDFELKPHRGEMVAYAVSKGQVAVGDVNRGGLWTHHLCENIKELVPLKDVMQNTKRAVSSKSKTQTPSFIFHDIEDSLIVATRGNPAIPSPMVTPTFNEVLDDNPTDKRSTCNVWMIILLVLTALVGYIVQRAQASGFI